MRKLVNKKTVEVRVAKISFKVKTVKLTTLQKLDLYSHIEYKMRFNHNEENKVLFFKDDISKDDIWLIYSRLESRYKYKMTMDKSSFLYKILDMFGYIENIEKKKLEKKKTRPAKRIPIKHLKVNTEMEEAIAWFKSEKAL